MKINTRDQMTFTEVTEKTNGDPRRGAGDEVEVTAEASHVLIDR